MVHLFFSCFITGSKKKPVVTLYILPENLPCQIYEFIRFPFYFSCDRRQQYCQTFCHYITRNLCLQSPVTFSSLSFKPSPMVSSRLFPASTNSLLETLSALVYHWVPKPMENALGSSATLPEPNSVLIRAASQTTPKLCGLKPEPSYYYL